MATQPTPAKARRIRRLPSDAEREILDAAEAALAERPFRDMSVDDLMRRTGMTRSTFYHYFRSLDEVAIALMRRVQGEMMDVATPWINAGHDEDPVASVPRAIRAVAEIYARHGRVLAAINDASVQHEAVERAWRDGILEDWIRAIAAQLRVQIERGVTRVENPEETARALLLMNTSVFVERLGKQDPPDPPESVAETLSQIWVGAIYPEALAAHRAS
ncbi:MAG TPA: TetR/AcrR family transcriptional regulator [Solirubrobacteraceae bacterium]|jgi:AcrR family transcriptional regulator